MRFGIDLKGTGFVVPRAEGISITAGAWISSKWPQRAPEGQALLRAFLGGARDPDVLSKTDHELDRRRARRSDEDSRHSRPADIDARLSVESLEPAAGSRARRPHAAHRRELARHPGLFVSAAGFRGVGIPDCIADARSDGRRRRLDMLSGTTMQ